MPLVSIIIPNYNHSEFLVQRIESVLAQTFQDFEVIIMDDCSTDNSRSIIEQYRSHSKVTQVIFNEINSGSTFKQWSKGLSSARGKYIWFAESDDWCEPNFLAYLLEGFEKDSECAISYCQSYIIEGTNVIRSTSHHGFLSEIQGGKSFLENRMFVNNPIFNASMVLWKKELFQHVSTEFTDYRLCGDWFFWMELCQFGNIHISGRVLNYFRNHDKDVSGKAMKSGLNFVETLKVINSFYLRQIISKKVYDRAFKIQFRAFYPLKNQFSPAVTKEITHLFQNPLSSKALYYKIYLSAIWKYKKL
ncbi:glycosyltransferase family 2 protein [Pedobacter sp. HMWF019]|uniref:glycosyltransferase family 2 protein n=1 Tax=Pedobacter sp. HMWF019 TaxID=2056856 RepID=UPI000D3C22A3|nr:glycosyltransferase [Pedobacter sp. HMWF019]PTS95917.1 glycosyltransferase family 2 protein [Pedobacter sp. HMWF019]